MLKKIERMPDSSKNNRIPSLVAIFVMVSACFVSGQDPNSVRFNALFLTNFAKFVQWPDETTFDEIVITVLGNDEVVEELKKISEVAAIRGKKLVVKVCQAASAIPESHMVFIPENQSRLLPEVLRIVENKSVLIVTNKKGLAEQGAAININNLYWKQRYEINQKALAVHKLIAKPELYRLGKVIE